MILQMSKDFAFFTKLQRHQEEVVQFQCNNLPNIYRPNIFNFFNPTSSFVLMCFCVLVAENARLTLP